MLEIAPIETVPDRGLSVHLVSVEGIKPQDELMLIITDTSSETVMLNPRIPNQAFSEISAKRELNARRFLIEGIMLVAPLTDSFNRMWVNNDMVGCVIELATVGILYGIIITHHEIIQRRFDYLKGKLNYSMSSSYAARLKEITQPEPVDEINAVAEQVAIPANS